MLFFTITDMHVEYCSFLMWTMTGPKTAPCGTSPSHVREFNRLQPHSSHDLVFKIWRNNKNEAALRVFVSDCELLVTKMSMGTTGMFIIKFKILPSINVRLSIGFHWVFRAKNQPKNRHFCMDFHLRRLSRKDYNQSLQKSRTVPPDIVTSLVCL